MILAAIRQHRSSRDHLQGAYLRQVRQDVVLDAIGKKSVFRVAAEISEGQDGDRFLEVPLRNARKNEVTDDRRNKHANDGEGEDVAASPRQCGGTRGSRVNFRGPVNPFGSDIERPTEDEGNGKASEHQ